MRGGSGGGGSVSARSLFSDATGGCPGEPGWSAGHCEMVPTSGWRERAGFPGQPVGLCGLARRRERPERAASGIAPGPRGAAAPLRLKARPGPGPVRSARRRAGALSGRCWRRGCALSEMPPLQEDLADGRCG